VTIQTFATIERLEERRLLAVAYLSAYSPMTVGSWWTYDKIDDGKRLKETDKVLPQTVDVQGETFFQMKNMPSRGHASIDLANVSAAGQLQTAGTNSRDGNVQFTPPVKLPLLAKKGDKAVSVGKTNMLIEGHHLVGTYRIVTVVAGFGRVTVPAGTFSTVRIKMSISMGAKDRDSSLAMRSSGTVVTWMAKGVGPVKSTSTGHTDVSAGGRHEESDDETMSVLRKYSLAP
jgi:hypothetical protein